MKITIQYIDKDALITEIKKRIKEIDEIGTYLSPKGTLTNLLCSLDTLETKEVNLERELDYDDYMSFFKEHPNYSNGDWGFEETWTFGQYCYKLGLAQIV